VHEAGQAASPVFQVIGMTRPGIEPCLLWWCMLNQLHHSKAEVTDIKLLAAFADVQ